MLVLTGSPVAAAALGAVFGLVRGLPLLALREVTTPQALRQAASRLARAARPAARGTSALLAGAAVVLGVAA